MASGLVAIADTSYTVDPRHSGPSNADGEDCFGLSRTVFRPVYADILKGGFFFPPFGPFLPLPLPSSPSEVGPLNPASASGGAL